MGVQHAARAVRPFDRQRGLTVGSAVESRAPRHQLAYVARAVLDEHAHRLLVAQPVAGRHRVRRMELRRIAWPDGRRDAALRVAGVAFPRLGLGEDEHVARARELGGCAERGDAAPDDEKIRAKLHARPDAVILPSPQHELPEQAPQDPVRLDVRTSTGRYAIEIAAEASRRLPALLDAAGVPARRFIVSNQTVWRFHGERLEGTSTEEPILIADGERFKHLATVGRIYDALIRAGADRASAIVALGGGVIGDVAGFAAATYLRGIALVHVPTTLLAQVDSAIGGKVGVNHPLGKNLIGAVPPAGGRRHRSGGPGHAAAARVPRGLVRSGELTGSLPAVRCSIGRPGISAALFARTPEALLPVVAESCRIKASIVEQDERESGLRRTLNFGHTAGHALEAVTKYRRFRHGEAVAYGMLAASALAVARGAFPAAERDALAALITKMGPLPPVGDLSAADVADATKRDKKVIAGRLHFVLPTAIGTTTTVGDVTLEELRDALVAIGPKN